MWRRLESRSLGFTCDYRGLLCARQRAGQARCGCLMMLTVGQVERWGVETGINQVPRSRKVGWLETPSLGHRRELWGL